MKIENDKPNPLTGATDALGPTVPGGPAPASNNTSAPANSADQLTLSAEAQLLKAAAAAAAGDSPVRSELVAKMRALLAEGQIGTDADSLADSLIDDLSAAPQSAKVDVDKNQ
jgi:flagellar biosynthesis anti-sigma factor FlgM